MKPPRLQLHLTTCIVLMFVAGGLMWANAHKSYKISSFPNSDLETPDPQSTNVADFSQGWPLPLFKDDYPAEYYYYPQNLAVDLTTAITILAAIAFGCEWLILRRRKKLDVSRRAPYSESGQCEDAAP